MFLIDHFICNVENALIINEFIFQIFPARHSKQQIKRKMNAKG